MMVSLTGSSWKSIQEQYITRQQGVADTPSPGPEADIPPGEQNDRQV